jgi:hypothetical protein
MWQSRWVGLVSAVALSTASARGGTTTPPTILQTWGAWLSRSRTWRRWGNPEDDVDGIDIDLYPLDKQTDQFAPLVPVARRQRVTHAVSKILQPADDQGQRRLDGRLVTQNLAAILEIDEPLA